MSRATPTTRRKNELATLKRCLAEFEGTLEVVAETSRARVKQMEQCAEALAERAHRADTLERELAAARARLVALDGGETLAHLRREKEALGRAFTANC